MQRAMHGTGGGGGGNGVVCRQPGLNCDRSSQYAASVSDCNAIA